MPFVALFGSLLHLVRNVLRGAVGGPPALQPIRISDRRNDHRRR